MVTKAVEIMGRPFILHIRRLGVRVFICLESHTMLVAGTDNILESKDGIDEEVAGTWLALSLEMFYTMR